jgi:hypothetical protein
MAEVSIGGAIGAGFTVIRQRPASVMLWGAVQLAFAIGSAALLSPVYVALFEAVRSGGGASAIQSANPAVMQTQALSYLLNILQAGLFAVVYCAAARAVLHPERSRFGYLRLGAPELFLFVLIIGAYIAFLVGVIMVTIVAGIVVALLVVMHAVWAAVAVGVIAAIATIAAVIYLALRFSLIGAMIVDDGRFHLGESWTLTRNHAGALFLIGLVLTFILLAAEIVLGIISVAIGVGALGAMAGGLQNLGPFFQQSPQALMTRLGPLLIVAAVIWAPFAGCMIAIVGAPWARAYRDLKPVDIAATFA